MDAKMSASIINKNQSASNDFSLSKELSLALAEAEKLQQAQEKEAIGKGLSAEEQREKGNNAILTPILTEAS